MVNEEIDFSFAATYPHNGRAQPLHVMSQSELRDSAAAYTMLSRAGMPDARIKLVLQEVGMQAPSLNESGVANFGAVDFNGELIEDDRQVPIDKLQRMTRFDGHARALLNILTMPTRSAKWQIVPAKDGIREAKFVEEMLTLPPHRGGMSIPFKAILGFLALAIRDRFKVVEKVWDMQRIDGVQRVVLRKLAPRPTETLKIRVDQRGDLVGVHQYTSFKGKTIDVLLPKEKILLFTFGKEEGMLGGESAFNAAHYHYDKKHKLYYIAHIAYSVAAIPPRIGTIPSGSSNKQEIDAFRNNMAALGLNTAMTKPEGWLVEALQLNRSFSDFMPLINHHDLMMALSVLAQFLRLGQTSGEGSFALSSNQSDIFIMAMQQFLDDLAETITAYLLPDIIDFNFGSGKYPTFKFETLSDKATAIVRELFGKLTTAADPHVTGEFMLEIEKRMAETLGLGVDYNAIEKELQDIATAERAAELAKQEQMQKAAENPPTLQNAATGPPQGAKPNVKPVG